MRYRILALLLVGLVCDPTAGQSGYAVTWNGGGVTTTANYALPTNVVFIQVSAGYHFSFGVTAVDGYIVARGLNDYGQVSGAPTSSGWSAVSAGFTHGLALKNNGTLAAWGDDTHGEGHVPTDTYSPGYDYFYTAIAAGEYFNLALRSDGTIFAWGHSTYGTTTVPNNTAGTYVAIAAGGHHATAKRANGKIAAWGGVGYTANSSCDGVSGYEYTHPGSVPSALANEVFLAVGAAHTATFAIREDRSIVSWGCLCGVQGSASVGNGYYVLSGSYSHAAVAGLYTGGVSLTTGSRLVQWGEITISNCTSILYAPPNNIPTALLDVGVHSIGSGNTNEHGLAILQPVN